MFPSVFLNWMLFKRVSRPSFLGQHTLPSTAANMPQPVNDQCEIKRQIMDATGNDYHLDVAYKQIHMGG